MNKIIVSLIFSFTVAMTVSAQDITSVFLSIPESVLFGLDAEAKGELVKNAKDTTSVGVMSGLNGPVKRLAMSDNFISLQTSPIGTMQIKLLPLVNNSKIICLTKTVCGKACDSSIEFYSTDWEVLDDVNLLPNIDIEYFVKADVNRTSEDFMNAYAALDMIPMKMELNADDFKLSVNCDLENYLSKEDYQKIKPYLENVPSVFTWNKIAFN